MKTFREMILEGKYNIEIDGNQNPYKGLDKSKLKKKQKAFETQISDLRGKVQNANFGSGGDKKHYFEEIEKLQLKLDQVLFLIKRG